MTHLGRRASWARQEFGVCEGTDDRRCPLWNRTYEGIEVLMDTDAPKDNARRGTDAREGNVP
jgi:hypothetical protein